MTNFGAHHLDIARWVLGARRPTRWPASAAATPSRTAARRPTCRRSLYHFPGCVVTWTARELNKGERAWDIDFHGTKGTLAHQPLGLQDDPRGRTRRGEATPRPRRAAGEGQRPRPRRTSRNFIDVREAAAPAQRRRRGGPSLGDHVPPRQHRHAPRPLAALGRREGRSSSATPRPRAALPSIPEALEFDRLMFRPRIV